MWTSAETNQSPGDYFCPTLYVQSINTGIAHLTGCWVRHVVPPRLVQFCALPVALAEPDEPAADLHVHEQLRELGDGCVGGDPTRLCGATRRLSAGPWVQRKQQAQSFACRVVCVHGVPLPC